MLLNLSDALLFTNAEDRVVFVDANLLLLLKCADAGRVVGEPLHTALGLEQQNAAEMLKEVSQTGALTERLLDVRRFSDGQPVRVRCSGVATYDPYGRYIGADLTVREAADGSDAAPQPAHHADSLKKLAVLAEASADVPQDEARLLAYFSTQMSALEVMLVRMGGFRIGDTLEKIVNQAAAQGGWPVSLKNGQVTVAGGSADPAAYRALLTEAMRYAFDVTSRRMALDEMQSVDDQMDAPTLAVVEQAGLRFSGLLPGG